MLPDIQPGKPGFLKCNTVLCFKKNQLIGFKRSFNKSGKNNPQL